MKRLFSVILLAGLLLCACGNGAGDSGEAQTTTLPADIMQKEDPTGDGVMNILFIGDSSCYYWTDELWGMLNAAGYENVNVCNLYYSGCTLKKHWSWWKEGAAKYEFFTVNSEGRKKVSDFALVSALEMQNWDAISFQNSKTAVAKAADQAGAFKAADPYLGDLLEYVRQQYPLSKYYWHENWSPELGYSNSNYAMETVEQRTQMHQDLKYVAGEVSKKFGLQIIPTGDAWEKVRDMELFTTAIPGLGVDNFTLCSRIASNAFRDDLGHDGDIGGGQYLNACVAFEVLTGKSCVGNTFRPAYTLYSIDCSLTEEKIQVLQKAAHEAVEAIK